MIDFDDRLCRFVSGPRGLKWADRGFSWQLSWRIASAGRASAAAARLRKAGAAVLPSPLRLHLARTNSLCRKKDGF